MVLWVNEIKMLQVNGSPYARANPSTGSGWRWTTFTREWSQAPAQRSRPL